MWRYIHVVLALGSYMPDNHKFKGRLSRIVKFKDTWAAGSNKTKQETSPNPHKQNPQET